jgi:hypothetical protein
MIKRKKEKKKRRYDELTLRELPLSVRQHSTVSQRVRADTR